MGKQADSVDIVGHVELLGGNFKMHRKCSINFAGEHLNAFEVQLKCLSVLIAYHVVPQKGTSFSH